MREWKTRAEEPERIAAERATTEATLRGIGVKTARLVEAITSGGGEVKPLVAEIKRLEREQADLLARLEHLDGLDLAREEFDLGTWLGEVKEALADLQATLEGTPQAGRQIIRRLLDGPVTVTPRTTEAGGLVFDYSGSGRYDVALAGVVVPSGQARRINKNNVGVRPGD